MFVTLIVALFVIAALCLGLAFAIHRLEKNRTAEIEAQFRPDVLFCKGHFIGFRFQDRRLVIGDLLKTHEYGFDQLTKCELVRDDVPVVSTDRGSQLTGALVGGALLGAPGAVIGGLSSGQRTTNNVKKVSLKVFVDDPVQPVHEVCFFSALGKGQKPGILNGKDIALAETFYAHCLNAMRTKNG